MLIEHSFITTKDGASSIQIAEQVLRGLGFQCESSSDTFLVARRGIRAAAYAKSISQQPQQVRLEYDRGRVTIAATITAHRKAGPLHRNLMLALVSMLESTLTQEQGLQGTRAEWDAVEHQIALAAARTRKYKRITITLLIVLAALILGAIILVLILVALDAP